MAASNKTSQVCSMTSTPLAHKIHYTLLQPIHSLFAILKEISSFEKKYVIFMPKMSGVVN
jgi:hypothetical protein